LGASRFIVCILLVEDESLIRLMLAEELALAGFEVCEAADGTQAAGHIENPAVPFSLLVTDVHLPGEMDGIQVARLMRARFPDVPIIYATGRPDTLDRMGRLSAKEKLVPKPFVPSDLVAMVRQLLPAH
jgi:DNA-binding response OmpR family regulator